MARASLDLDPLASIVQRLGVLLAAGVTPVSGWVHLAELAQGGEAPRLRSIAAAAERGESIVSAIVEVVSSVERVRSRSPSDSDASDAWRGLAAAWQVATEAGAPLAPTLAGFATSLRSLAQNQRDLRTALAAPAATARMVMVLPIIGVLFGLALGFDTLGILFGTPPGLACLAVGGALMLAARWWNGRLIRSARPRRLTPGLGFDLMAIAVSGGASIPRARAAVAEARRHCGLPEEEAEAALDEVLELSRRAGVPAATLLRSEAEETRRRARSEGERKAAKLAVTLMLPLGLCILPAFMVLGVAPLLIAVISSTVASF
ncbi:MAG TPA: type II secretion system F family protein [Lacisediminihabitans sp.]|uniref:type II secretion system F family protein n=1 Tax=Lacisediminihabitans sp. TaxID=2787631 RepID=UPI002ED94F56